MTKPAVPSHLRIVSVFLLLTLWTTNNLFAEGTKELHPKKAQNGPYLQIWDTPDQPTRRFATFDPDSLFRLNIRVCNMGEKVFFGLRQNDNNVFFRIIDPNGNQVRINGITNQLTAPNFTYRIPTTGNGFINTWDEAVAGPKGPAPLSAAGYNALSFVPQMTGDYYIQFNPGSATALRREKRMITFFDMTVVDTVANRVKLGRLWSRAWDINCNSGTNTFDTRMFVYSRDSVVTALDFNGMQPFGFVVSCNSTGCTNTGNSGQDRKSRVGNVTYPEYRIFLNDPDSLCYPTKKSFGQLTGPVRITGCDLNNRCVNIPVDKAGDVEILFDFEAPVGYNGPTSRDLLLKSTVIAGNNCIRWNSRDGRGNLVPSGSTFDIEVNYFNGLTHLPIYDIEDHRNGYTVSPVRPSGTSPRLFWDDSEIVAGTALDGKVQTIGVVTGHRFLGRGANNCPGGPQTCPETINTWWYGNVIKTTVQYTDTSIAVDANRNTPGLGSPANDTTVCTNVTSIQLRGLVAGFTNTGIWSKVTGIGQGSFQGGVTNLNASYIPSATERVAGNFVTLRLTSTNNGACGPINDTMRIFFIQGPEVDAGNNRTVCKNNPDVQLAGTRNAIATNISWEGGTGTFVPNRLVLNPVYTPSEEEINSGNPIKLYLRSTAQGTCPSARDSMTISFIDAPLLTVGPTTVSICKNNPVAVSLNGASSTGSGTWTGGTTSGFSPNRNTLTASYLPTATEIALGNPITLTLTSTNNGTCLASTISKTITFTNPPTSDAGSSLIVCTNNREAQLGGISSTSEGIWTRVNGTGGVFIPAANVPNARFVPTVQDSLNGTPIILRFTTTNNPAGCVAASDTMRVSFKGAPSVNASMPFFVCKNSPTIQLNSTSSTGSVEWVGAGVFTPNRFVLNPQYTASQSDLDAGVVSVIARTTNNGDCNATSTELGSLVKETPIVSLGSDKTVCRNNNVVTINDADVSNVNLGVFNAVQWSASISGSFTPSNTQVNNVSFIPTDTTSPFTLTLRAREEFCLDVQQSINVNYTPSPVVNAGSNVTVCKNNPIVQLSGTSTTGRGRWSRVGGTGGVFTPNDTTLNATFTPSATDIANGNPITLRLTSLLNGTCNAVSREMTISFINAPTVEAGNDVTVCANNFTGAQFTGTSSTGSGVWSGGLGSFSPSLNANTVNYTPEPSELTGNVQRTIKFYFTSTNNDLCLAVRDSANLIINPRPIASAGTDISRCANNPNAQLNASLTRATGGIWSGGQGSFTPSENAPNATYIPTSAEVFSKSVRLIWSADQGLNGCSVVSDTVLVNYTDAPTISAGGNKVICENIPTVSLTGTTLGATGVQWVDASGVVFGNALSSTYTLKAADITQGFARVVIRSTAPAGCLSVTDTAYVFISKVPSANAGPNQTICFGETDATLVATGGTGVWTITTGAGTLSNPNSLITNFTPNSSIEGGFAELTYTVPAQGACLQVSSKTRVNVLPGTRVNAGDDQEVCGSNVTVSLNGLVSGNTNVGVWTTNGQGTINNPNNLNALYSPSSQERTQGAVVRFILSSRNNGQCLVARDTMFVTIRPTISLNAGPNVTVCANNSFVNVAATVTNTTINTWSSPTGGVFSSPNSTASTYQPTPADISNGSVILSVTSNPGLNNICPALTRTLTVTINPAPTVNVTSNFTVCGDTNSIDLSASSSTGSGLWSVDNQTSGAFTPSNAQNNTRFVFADAIRNAGGVLNFTFSSQGNGICNAVSNTTQVTVIPRPTINAGPNDTICATGASVNLAATFTNITSLTWGTNGGTGTFINPSQATAQYNPSNADITAGLVIIRVTGNRASCKPVVSTKTVLFTPRPTIAASGPLTYCQDFNQAIPIGANVNNATGATWTLISPTSGSFANANSRNTNYTLSNGDRNLVSLRLRVTTTGNGKCDAVSDTLLINLTPRSTASPDSVLTICADKPSIRVTSQTSTNSGIWTRSGSGNFAPKADSTTVNYVFSNADRNNGSVVLTFTTTNNGSCPAVVSRRTISITPAPTVSIPALPSICADRNTVDLSSTRTGASGVSWTRSGTGSFNSNVAENPTYTLSAQDKSTGSVLFTATTTGNGICNAVSASRTLTITPAPTINVGQDLSVCADRVGVQLNSSRTVATGVQWSGGQGVFGASNSIANPNYFPTETEKNAAPTTIVLRAITTGNGNCNAVRDSLILTILPRPIVDAGPSQLICGDINGASLQASVNIATGVNWSVVSGGTGTFSANANILNPTFVPSVALKNTGGKVILRARTTGNGICNAVEDTVSVTINPIPRIVSVGDPLSMCEDNDGVGLGLGVFTGAPDALWTTSGKGVVANNGTISATYLPSEEDIKAGQVTLTLVTEPGNTTCRTVSANRILTITKAPEVNAGPDFELCTDIDTIRLSGGVTNATGVYWRALSDGVFLDDNVKEAKFVPVSTAETITFILSSTGNGACNEAIDSVKVSFSPGPQIFAGNDFTVCNTNLPFRLNGSGTRGRWTILQGAGTFEPNDSTLNATFVPSTNNVGTYRFRVTPISTCAVLTDDVEVTVIEGPVPNAPADFNVCENVSNPINISGSVSLGAGVRWLTNGSGDFTADNSPVTQYTPSDADKTSGSVTLTLQTVQDANCRSISDVVVISFDKAPSISTGDNEDYCENINSVALLANVDVASGVTWTNLSSGNLPVNPNVLSTTYNIQPVDRSNGLVRFVATSTGSIGTCNQVTDTVTFVLKPLNQVNAGSDLTVCKSNDFVQVTGTFQNAGGVVWSTKGEGRFTPDSTSLTTRYLPSVTDKENNAVTIKLTTTNNGLCPGVSDSLEISFTEPREVFAGNDTIVCANIESFQFVAGKNAFTTNVVWSTLGTGTFTDTTVLNAVYIPSDEDRVNGAVVLRISSKDVSECENVADFMLLNLSPVPVSIVNAGIDQDICKDRSEVFLNGTILVAGGGQWSVLNSPNVGTFLETDTSLSARYLPTIEDKNQGSIKIALTTILNGVCGPSIDTMDIRFTDVPTVSINNSVPDTVCADVSSITFSGAVTVGRSVRWSTNGSGTFVPNPFASTVTYFPSDDDKVNGLLGVTLTSEENGNCVGEYLSNKSILIEKETRLIAGTDLLACKNNPVVRLNGRVENQKTGASYSWRSSTGTGIFSPPGANISNSINTVFIPSTSDLDNGAVLLTFASTNNSKCLDKSSQLLLTFGPAPVLEAGPDRTLCVNNADVFLAPSISGGASQGLWSSSGSGTFVEDPTSNATRYIPSAEDLDQPSVRLIIRTSDNTDGKCLPVSDTIRVSFTPAPRISASSAFPCVYVDGVELNGTVTEGATQGVWKTSANGVFAPNPTSLSARYFPSDADKVQGDISVYLVSTDNGNCKADSAVLTLLVAPLPEANAGDDRFVCQGANDTLFANPGLNYTYSWRQIGGAFTAGNLNRVVVGPISNAVQTYELRVDDNKGCSAFDTVRVRSVVNPNLSIDDKYCLVPSMKIGASAPNSVTQATFQWYKDGVLLQGANDTILRVFQPGNYSLNYSLGKCNVHNTQTRVIQPPILVTLDHIYCKEDIAFAEVRNLLLNPVDYVWSIDGVTIGGNASSVSNVVTEDTTIFNVLVTDADGCFSRDSVFMLAKTRPVTALELNSPGCKGETVTLNATPTPVLYGATRSWTKDGNAIADTAAIITVAESGLGAGRFIVRYALDRCVALDTADVVFNVLPTPPFGNTQQEFCSITDLTKVLDANPTNVANLRFKWLTPTNPTLNAFDTLRTYVVDSTGFMGGNSNFYKVRLTNEFNCSSVDSIRLRDFCVPKIHVPNALTPNKDGVNDKLQVFGLEKFFKNFEMYIFNRWGEVIFKTNDPKEAWDGTYRGDVMPVGTYPYLVTFESTDPRDLTKYKNQGKVTVVR